MTAGFGPFCLRRVLSTATLTRPARPAAPSAPASRTEAGGAGSVQRPRVLGPYAGYVGYFVGTGLISGGLVHHPLDPARYAKVALAGVAVFLAATVLNDVVLAGQRASRTGVLRLVSASLLLSLGIGMLSGGIQHFADFPARSAVLVPG